MNYSTPFLRFSTFCPLRNPGDKKVTTQKLSTILGAIFKLFMFRANGFRGYPHAQNRCKLLIELNKKQLSTAHPHPLATTTIFK